MKKLIILAIFVTTIIAFMIARNYLKDQENRTFGERIGLETFYEGFNK